MIYTSPSRSVIR